MQALFSIAVLLLCGCTAKRVLPVAETMPPFVLAGLGDAGVRDLRHLYRAAVCGQLPTGSPPCEELILLFPNEAAAGSLSKPTGIQNRYQIAFVPGFFSDCLNGMFYPFTDVITDLRDEDLSSIICRLSATQVRRRMPRGSPNNSPSHTRTLSRLSRPSPRTSCLTFSQ